MCGRLYQGISLKFWSSQSQRGTRPGRELQPDDCQTGNADISETIPSCKKILNDEPELLARCQFIFNRHKKRQPEVLHSPRRAFTACEESATEKDGMFQKMLNKVVGAKYVSILRTWVPNMVTWGAAGGVALIHFTDWRLILDYVPYINGKFSKDE